MLHVAADDRTGALEVAAALADRGAGGAAGVTVTVWPEQSSRRTCASSTSGRATSRRDTPRRRVPPDWPTGSGRPQDRLDVARQLGARARRPSSHEHGCPVHARAGAARAGTGVCRWRGAQRRAPGARGRRRRRASRSVSSRPAEHLRAAGAERRGRAGVGGRCSRRGSRRRAATRSSMPAPTPTSMRSSPCGRARRCCSPARRRRSRPRPAVAPSPVARRITGPVLVVCGSANPVARRQLAVARRSAARRSPKDAASALQALRRTP